MMVFMEQETIKLRTSIKTPLMRRVVLRGSFLALLGAAILLYAGVVMPVDSLSIWGLPLLLVSGSLITLGLLPYRKLTRLEKKPDELIISENQIQYIVRGKSSLTIPQQNIARTAYVEHGNMYGICVWLKHPTPNKNSRYDLFFPYFSEKAALTLQELR